MIPVQAKPIERADAPDLNRGEHDRRWIGGETIRVEAGAILVLSLLAAALGSVYLQQPPAPDRADRGAGFSLERAMRHVRALAVSPRPIGSPAHGAAEAYIVGELRSLGIEPEIQAAVMIDQPLRRRVHAGRIRNIAARLRGTASGKAVMLSAHYDSVPISPGAADNAEAVASLLETARVIRAGPALRNDVILLFTDAEETGQLGALAFLDRHPWAKDVDVVLNFDARGNEGPVLMFQTGRDDAALIREFRRAASHPVASSLFAEAYRLMPNTTDFTHYRARGLGGLNLANIGGIGAYHSSTDRADRLDERTLAHQGSYAVHLTRRLGNASLPMPRTGSSVYFNVAGPWLISYPANWTLPLTALACLSWAALVWWSVRRSLATWRGVSGAAIIFPLLTAAAILVGRLGVMAWTMTGAGGEAASLYIAGLAGVVFGVILAADAWLRPRVSIGNATLGALGWVTIVLIAVTFVAPGASYLVLVSLLLGLTAPVTQFARPASSMSARIILMLTAVAIVGLVTPVLVLMYTGLTVTAAPILLAVGVLVVATLMPQLRWLGGGWRMPSLVLLTSVVLLAAAIWGGSGASRERRNHLFYVLQADTGRAYWASLDADADEWTGRFVKERAPSPFGEALPSRRGTWLQGAAPVASMGAPSAEVIADTVSGDKRTRTIRIASTRAAALLTIAIGPVATVASVDGRPLDPRPATPSAPASPGMERSRFEIQYRNAPAEGITVTVETGTLDALSVDVVDASFGLDTLPGVAVPQRPEFLSPASAPFSDAVLVARSFVFEPPSAAAP
jgi:hypothetical protein